MTLPIYHEQAPVVELADTLDSKSSSITEYRFKSDQGYKEEWDTLLGAA